MDNAPEKVTAFEKRIKRQVIGKPHRFLAVVPLGFEQTLVDEVEYLRRETRDERRESDSSDKSVDSLDIKIVGDGKVEFTTKLVEAWKAVAYSRVANRILMHIADFKAENFRELERKAAEVPWELYLDEKHGSALRQSSGTSQQVSIHVTCKHSRLYHSDAVAERLQKVIAHQAETFLHLKASETSDLEHHTSSLHVTLIDDRCTLWLDLAGKELYKRGHERFVNDAPLKETIAAGMLFEAFHMASQPIALFDPMAGSGTFSLEAAYMANNLIPGKCRDFALKHQPAFKEATWRFLLNESGSALRQGSGTLPPTGTRDERFFKIVTSDISEKAAGIIAHNVECCPLAEIDPKPIVPQCRDFFSYTAKEIADACSGEASPVIVLNPPYGKRLDFDAPKLYTQIGKKLAELARELNPLGKQLTVAILAPKDDSRPSSRFTCTANLLHECPALDPAQSNSAKRIVTSHGGLTLNTFIAKI